MPCQSPLPPALHLYPICYADFLELLRDNPCASLDPFHPRLLLPSTIFGALNGTGLRYLRRARSPTAGGRGGRAQDHTKYDTTLRVRLIFFEHHARRLSGAAVIGDAAVHMKAITATKVRAQHLTARIPTPLPRGA